MKTNKFTGLILAALCSVAVSCSDDWSDHYDVRDIEMAEGIKFDIYKGDVTSFMKNSDSLSQITELFENTGVLETMTPEQEYTLVLCSNDDLNKSLIFNDTAFVKNSISDTYVSPDKLKNNFGILTRYETLYDKKNLRVFLREGDFYIEDFKIVNTIKADNGYVYIVDGTIQARESIYEKLKSLPDAEYSLFKSYVAEYEEEYFDIENSTVGGIDDMGNTFYTDSVMRVRNTLMDRYTAEGLNYWNMRSENYTTTMFVPTNEMIEKALNDAYTNLPVWLNRAVSASDSLKFKQWIIKSCFVDRRLSQEEVMAGSPDFYCVGGYTRSVDVATDVEKFTASDSAYWRPSAQLVDLSRVDTVSNGVVYYLSDYKIPNHIVIYRVKSKFYQIWAALTAEQQAKYFRWTNWIDPAVCNDAQSEFTLTESLPTMYYHVLTAEPTQEAISAARATDSLNMSKALLSTAEITLDSLRLITAPDSMTLVSIDSLSLAVDSLQKLIPIQQQFADIVGPNDYMCKVEYDGLLYNTEDRNYGIVECNLPAGEYRLSMGFKHSLKYSLSIYFNDRCLIKDMAMAAQGSNYHFDRGGASSMTFFGEGMSVAYPEGFDANAWYEKDVKSVAYDTDGWPVDIVTIPEDGNFRIRIESVDNALNYDPTNNRSKNNVTQLMMYHWCLRPTVNNY